MKLLLKNSIFGLCLLFAAPASAQIEADRFVGKWSCQPEGDTPAFEWHVHKDLEGDWLVGQGYENKVLTSLDVWAFNKDGSLSTRRQFTPDGGFIVMNQTKSTPKGFKNEGSLTKRDGSVIKLTHYVSFTSPDSFKAVWQAIEDLGAIERIVETCTRIET